MSIGGDSAVLHRQALNITDIGSDRLGDVRGQRRTRRVAEAMSYVSMNSNVTAITLSSVCVTARLVHDRPEAFCRSECREEAWDSVVLRHGD